jgi:hypothetical protein
MFESLIIGDAARNVIVNVRGVIDQDILEPRPILTMEDLKADSKQTRDYIKIASVWWLIQEKMTILLTWSDNPEDIIFPMESRNAMTFHRFLDPPKGWSRKIWLRTANFASGRSDKMAFAFCLDIDR